MSKVHYLNELLLHKTTWMDLKYITLSERNQTQNIIDAKLQVHGFPSGLSLAGEVTL